MKLIEENISSIILDSISNDEKIYLNQVFNKFNGYPPLKDLWKLMDEAWVEIGCNPFKIDNKINIFYNHPVWLLNGLFIEQDEMSLKYRKIFLNWIKKKSPSRIADFGGGFGGLARLIAEELPRSKVEIIEPHPHPAAISLINKKSNIEYKEALTGKYDLLIATDVFEHIINPLEIAYETSTFLKEKGTYLIANCFAPVIKCHLPQLFYFQICWTETMREMGLKPKESISYGISYERDGQLDLIKAKKVEALGKKLYKFLKILPKGKSYIGNNLLRILNKFY